MYLTYTLYNLYVWHLTMLVQTNTEGMNESEPIPRGEKWNPVACADEIRDCFPAHMNDLGKNLLVARALEKFLQSD